MKDSKEKFIALFNAWVKRPGADKLLEWLESTDFFEAPASTVYHGSYPGGLVEHSLNVCRELGILSKLPGTFTDEWHVQQTESLVLCALLHDMCKADFYDKYGIREDGSVQYTVNNRFPLGHGEKSLYLISQFIRLTREEALAIRWHMGIYDDAADGKDFGEAEKMYPLVKRLHKADVLAAWKEMDGGRTGEQ